MPRVYLDTSFFIGLLENQSGKGKEYRRILRYEHAQGSQFFTSQLTMNEYLVGYYDKYKRSPECETKVQEAVDSICGIATVHGISEEVCKRSARLMSLWGERRRQAGNSPRDKKFRWDSIHLATADVIGVGRLYAHDGPWDEIPRDEIPGIAEIISPPKLPQGLLDIGWGEDREGGE